MKRITFERAAQAGLFGEAFPPSLIQSYVSPLELLRELESQVCLGRLDAAGTLEVAKSIIRDVQGCDLAKDNDELSHENQCFRDEIVELREEIKTLKASKFKKGKA